MHTGTAAAAVATATPLATTVAGLLDGLADAYQSALAVPGVAIAVVVLFLAFGAVVSTYAIRLLGRPVARRFARESVAHVVLRGIRLVVVLLFGAAGLSAAGVELGSIVLSVTVFSAVVAVVLAPIVGSIISGVFVLADQPFEIGDMVELPDGTRGFVDDITLRYTKVFTVDNTFEVIPNSYIRDQRITNLSAEDERTRLSLAILVTYESDIDRARSLIERAAASCEAVIEGGPDIRIGVARYPAKPTCYIDSFGDHGVELTLRYWAKNPFKPLTVRSQVQTAVWDILEEDDSIDVEFAYPHSHLVFDDTSGVAQVTMREEDAVSHERATHESHAAPGEDGVADGAGSASGEN
ncbi:mechanosensitive ion channel family protein [Halobaculum magnesiiphilum]|uniref:Mechanosensitive ion channel family protein n=1 Tax=Halobaculum magnesiiphilum TaxID=1017351 RepID=A0A8T8WD77_9EURY|nr:mechanosensitive ion channel family protein [Halobaculum magnesiiphilum]QZP37817.1 mechanosensitive ion channel family protein [Halobaculum magnesiiphilum]